MSISRVSSNYLVEQGVSYVQNSMSMISKLQEQIATGQQISAPSDDPARLAQLLRITKEMNQDDVYEKNIDAGISEISAADGAITSILEVANRARELAIRGANGTQGSEQFYALAREVDSLLGQVVQLGNTSYAGRYIFSGFRTNTPTFSVAGSNVTYNGTPPTSGYQRTVQVAKNTTVAINVNGRDLLGEVTATAAGPPATVTGQAGLIYSLTKLKLDLENSDIDAVRADIDLITTDQNTLLKNQATLGARLNQLELTKNRIEDWRIVQTKQVSQIQDVDMSEAISTLNLHQTSYQASLGVLSRILQTSLVNFLR